MAGSSNFDIVRAGSLDAFSTLVRDLGGDDEDGLRKFGLTRADLAEPDRFVPYSAVGMAIEVAARDLGVADFGLRMSDLQRPESYGPLWIMMKSAPTVRDGMLLGIRHVSFYVPAQAYRNFRSADGTLECVELFHRVPHLPDLPQTVENSVSQIHRFVQALSDHAVSPAEIHFRHPQIADDDRYKRHFGIVPQFESSFDGLALDPSSFRRRIPDQSPLLKQFAERFLSEATPRTRQTTAQQVSALLHNLVRSQMAALSTVAALMGMHQRTLQRRLTREGKTFEDLRDEARKEFALQLLPQDHISLAQVADMLGYADQSVLTHACRRWFGQTPMQVRQGLLKLSEISQANSERSEKVLNSKTTR